jgi:hypothetical protein
VNDFDVASYLKYKVMVKLPMFPRQYKGIKVWLYSVLTLAGEGGEWPASGPGCFTPGERNHGACCNRGLNVPKSRFVHFEEGEHLLSLPRTSKNVNYI